MQKSKRRFASWVMVILVGAFLAMPTLSARSVLNINTTWKFNKSNVAGATAVSYNDSGTGWSTVFLPHTFEYMTYNPANSFYHGIGTYRKHLTLGSNYAGKKVYLTLEGASSTAQVYVNGTLLASHYYGWTPVIVDITNNITTGTTDNIITVYVNNTSSTDVPGTAGPLDYMVNGGLFRDVYLTVTDNVHVPDAVFGGDAGGGTFVTYPQVTNASATVAIKTWVKNSGTASVNATVQWTILNAFGTSVGTAQSAQTINANVTMQYQNSIAISNPILWSPANPYRYTLRIQVLQNGTTLLDDYEEKIGIRKIAFSQTAGFSINGNPLKLFGVNRHEMWPFVGHAVPNNLQLFDARFLKDMGCNMLRLSHYPQDPSFLNACDSLGILVYEEAPGGSNNNQMPPYSATWDTRARIAMREMIRRDRNRPSVICWGTLNEPAQNAVWEASADSLLKTLDTTRPSTESRNYSTGNNVFSLYAHNSFTDLPTSNPDPSTIGYLNSEHTGHTFPTKRDTTEQRLLDHAYKHEFMAEVARARPWVAGGLGWCAFDYNSAASWSTGSNIMFHGVNDLMRIPKFAYYFYQSQKDTSSPMVFIANFWTTTSPISVKVYSNCEQVRLSTWNGTGWVAFATQTPDAGRTLAHPPFTFALASHASDRLRAEGLIGGVVRATHIVRQPLTAKKLVVNVEPDTFVANGSDLSRVLISVVDSNGTICPYATATINVSLSGPGTLIGDNPITAANEATMHQCASFGILAQSRYGASGNITITAASTGLTSATGMLVSLPYASPVSVGQNQAKSGLQYLKMQPHVVLNMLSGIVQVTCTVPKDSKVRVRAYSSNGSFLGDIYNGYSPSQTMIATWNTNHLTPGVYLVKVEVDGNCQVVKTLIP